MFTCPVPEAKLVFVFIVCVYLRLQQLFVMPMASFCFCCLYLHGCCIMSCIQIWPAESESVLRMIIHCTESARGKYRRCYCALFVCLGFYPGGSNESIFYIRTLQENKLYIQYMPKNSESRKNGFQQPTIRSQICIVCGICSADCCDICVILEKCSS